MVENRVSVRLVAEGGRQVRAELEGEGEAGARGFGRLSREMDLANARMAAFARRAQVAAAATVALAAAGAAMIRSGLQTVDAQAKLAASLGTTVASIRWTSRPAIRCRTPIPTIPPPWDSRHLPWWARITCSPAPGYAGTVDKTSTTATQVAALFGTATPASFNVSGECVS